MAKKRTDISGLIDRQSLKLVALGALGVFAVHSTMATSQVIKNHNSNAPVDVAADRIELQDRNARVLLVGGVTVSQAGLTLKSSRMTVAYSGGGGMEINRIDATGGVTITKDDMRATSNSAIYDIDGRIITLIGNVNLVDGTNRLSGARVMIDLASRRSAISGSGSSDAASSGAGTSKNNGRVTGRFTVPQRSGN